MRQVIGSPARKTQFYKRPDIRKDILDAIGNGENILISAPRRVGKTSVMMDLVDDPDTNVFAVYQNTEAMEDPDEFYKLILKNILNADKIEGFGTFSRRAKEILTGWANKIAGISISGVAIELREGQKVSFYNQLCEFLSEINLEGKRIAILVDEFPITVENIHKKYGIEGVKLFLDQNRALRQNPSFSEKVNFIYCGSIGLFTVVKKLKATDRINDLREIKIGALRKANAEELVNILLYEKTKLAPNTEIMEYILHKIEWWIPFYFQLLVKEMSDMIIYENCKLNEKVVDSAFEKVAENGNIYFEHFKSRLYKTFEKEALAFVLEFLTMLKNRENIGYDEVLDMAEGKNIRMQADDILDILKYDGYIIKDEKSYKFYSPILKKWWK